MHDTRRGFVPVEDGDAEAFGAEFVAGATSNDAIGEIARDELDVEEIGSFVFDALEDELELPDLP